jgi:hypothetical protein
MRATLLLKSREPLGQDRFIERVVWKVPAPLAGSDHAFKYRLAFVVKGRCVVRYDNEAGKGNYRHWVGADGIEREVPYDFRSVQSLLDDFWREVDQWREP